VSREGKGISRPRHGVSSLQQLCRMPPSRQKHYKIKLVSLLSTSQETWLDLQRPLRYLRYRLASQSLSEAVENTEIAIKPDFPKQCSIVAWKELDPLNFELITIRRIVQSTCSLVRLCHVQISAARHTVMVNPTRRSMPVARPACRNAYGWPMMPAPLPICQTYLQNQYRNTSHT